MNLGQGRLPGETSWSRESLSKRLRSAEPWKSAGLRQLFCRWLNLPRRKTSGRWTPP